MNQLEALQAVAQLPPPLGYMGGGIWIFFLCSLQSVPTHVQIPLFLVGFSCHAMFDPVLSYLGGVIPLTGNQGLKCEEVDIYQKLSLPTSCKIMECSFNIQNSFLFLVKTETTLALINKVYLLCHSFLRDEQYTLSPFAQFLSNIPSGWKE